VGCSAIGKKNKISKFGDHLLLRDFGPYRIIRIIEYVCRYNRINRIVITCS
jgi:transposase